MESDLRGIDIFRQAKSCVILVVGVNGVEPIHDDREQISLHHKQSVWGNQHLAQLL